MDFVWTVPRLADRISSTPTGHPTQLLFEIYNPQSSPGTLVQFNSRCDTSPDCYQPVHPDLTSPCAHRSISTDARSFENFQKPMSRRTIEGPAILSRVTANPSLSTVSSNCHGIPLPLPLETPADIIQETILETPNSTESRHLLNTSSSVPLRTDFHIISSLDMEARRSRGIHPPEVWQSHKSTIKQLYLNEGKPLKHVMQIMQQHHNFKASEKMYKTRFRQWGFEKNNTKKTVSRMLLTKFRRDIAGKPTQFSRHGKDIDIQKYLRRKGATEYDIIDFEAKAELTRAVRCCTPPPVPEASGFLRSPDAIRYQEVLLQHARTVFLHLREESSVLELRDTLIDRGGFWERDNTFQILLGDEGHSLGGYTDTDILMQHAAFQRLHDLLEDDHHSYITLSMLFDTVQSSHLGLVLSIWKYITAYWFHRNRYHPSSQMFGFLYNVIQKEGISELYRLLENSSLHIVEEIERIFGRHSHWTYEAWSNLRPRFRIHAIERFKVLLEGLETDSSRGCHQGGSSSIEMMVIRCKLMRKIDPTSTAALVGWQQLYHIVAESHEIHDRHRTKLLSVCAYNLHRIHVRHCWHHNAEYNVRLQLAIYYLEETIQHWEILSGNAASSIIDELLYLEDMYQVSGWSEKAIHTRYRRQQHETALSTLLQLEGASA